MMARRESGSIFAGACEGGRTRQAREHALSARRAEVIADLDRLVREIERTELSLQAFVQSNDAVILFVA